MLYNESFPTPKPRSPAHFHHNPAPAAPIILTRYFLECRLVGEKQRYQSPTSKAARPACFRADLKRTSGNSSKERKQGELALFPLQPSAKEKAKTGVRKKSRTPEVGEGFSARTTTEGGRPASIPRGQSRLSGL